jgi:hypothetical protein
VLGLLTGVVIAVAVVVFVWLTTKMMKPATESPEERRDAAGSSAPMKTSPTARAAAVTAKGGRTVVDSGKQFGRNLVELAKSSVTIPPAQGGPPPPRPPTPPAPPSTAAPNGSRTPGRYNQPKPGPDPVPVAVASSAATSASPSAPATSAPPASTGVRAVASSLRAAAATTASRLAAQPAAQRSDPSEEYEFIVPSVPRRARVRLYPPWWKRVFSFVVLGALTLACGIAVGTAIGALIAFLNRAVQSSL